MVSELSIFFLFLHHHPPPPMVTVQAVRILLECILVYSCFGSNKNAFYLYTVTSEACSSTPCNVHAWLYRECGYCSVLSIPCITIISSTPLTANHYHHDHQPLPPSPPTTTTIITTTRFFSVCSLFCSHYLPKDSAHHGNNVDVNLLTSCE